MGRRAGVIGPTNTTLSKTNQIHPQLESSPPTPFQQHPPSNFVFSQRYDCTPYLFRLVNT
jgi:hypothetical protein